MRLIKIKNFDTVSHVWGGQIFAVNEERTIVAGMAPYYKKEDMLGKKIIVLTNLEPRKLRGIQSKGMLLAAESKDGKVKLLTIDGDIETGAEIH